MKSVPPECLDTASQMSQIPEESVIWILTASSHPGAKMLPFHFSFQSCIGYLGTFLELTL